MAERAIRWVRGRTNVWHAVELLANGEPARIARCGYSTYRPAPASAWNSSVIRDPGPHAAVCRKCRASVEREGAR